MSDPRLHMSEKGRERCSTVLELDAAVLEGPASWESSFCASTALKTGTVVMPIAM